MIVKLILPNDRDDILRLDELPETSFRTIREEGRGCFEFRESILILTHDSHGRPLLIARSYLDGLRSIGWLNTDQIPAECIVEDE